MGKNPKRHAPKCWKTGRVTLCSDPLIPPAKKPHSNWFQGLCFREGGFLVCVLKAYRKVQSSHCVLPPNIAQYIPVTQNGF